MEGSKKVLWTGRAVSALGGLAFLSSGLMKALGGPQAAQMLNHLGIREALLPVIAALELGSVAVYLVPRTSVLGAILLTGFMGGAVMAHLRIGEPPIVPVVLGVLVWLGLFLRDARLRALLPLRSPASAGASMKAGVTGSPAPSPSLSNR